MKVKNRTVAAILPLIALSPLVMGASNSCSSKTKQVASGPTMPMPSMAVPIPVATADANAFDPQIGRSIICSDSIWPMPHGFTVRKIDGVRYLVGEVHVECIVDLKSFALSISVGNLQTKAIHNTGSGVIPGTGVATDGDYEIKILCVPGGYVMSYLGKVVSFDGRESWFGNIAAPATITADDCNQVGVH